MSFLRNSALAACVSLLVVTLFWFGLLFSLHQVIGTPAPIKQALKASGIYQSVVGDALDQAQKNQKQQGASSGSDIPVGDPQVRSIVAASFPPSYLEGQTEQVINSLYAWLQGATPTLQFTVNLADAKLRLANGVQQYVQTRLSSLPVCTANAIPASTDPFSAACVPAGFDIAGAAAQARDKILGGDFLKNPNVSATSIKTDNGKTLQQKVQNVPMAYKRSVQIMYGMGVLALVFGAGTVLLSAVWRAGARKVAKTFIWVGGCSAAVGWVASVLVRAAAAKLTAQNNGGSQSLQLKAAHIIEALVNDLRNWWVGYGLLLVVLGIVALIVLHATTPKATEKPGTPLEHPEGSLPNTGGVQAAAQPGPQPAPKPKALPKFKKPDV